MQNNEQIVTPPVNPPPAGKNYVYINGKWELVDNPVFHIKPVQQTN